MSGPTEPYVVEIKHSARRINGAASEWVARRGGTRTFATKADARRWANAISGDGAVRVQDAAPNDPDDVDGYLVADPLRRRHDDGAPATTDATVDSYAPAAPEASDASDTTDAPEASDTGDAGDAGDPGDPGDIEDPGDAGDTADTAGAPDAPDGEDPPGGSTT